MMCFARGGGAEVIAFLCVFSAGEPTKWVGVSAVNGSPKSKQMKGAGDQRRRLIS